MENGQKCPRRTPGSESGTQRSLEEGRGGNPYRSKIVCRAGERGGARTEDPRQMRIAWMTLGWVIAEMTSALPPHCGQRRTSSWNTLLSNSAQGSLLSRRRMGSPGATSKRGTVASEDRSTWVLTHVGVSDGVLFLVGARSRTTWLRHFAPGAKTPW